jgi:hypothetical protein
MKKYTFKVGDRVGFAAQYSNADYEYEETFVPLAYDKYGDNSPEFGTVLEVNDQGECIKVDWDPDGNFDEEVPDKKDIVKFLMPEKDLKELIPNLEKEYKDFVQKLSPKIKEAAKIIREIGKETRKKGYELADVHELNNVLVNAMDASGWRSSSWGC